MPKHELQKTDTGYACSVCQWEWKREPENRSYNCPGMPRFGWWNAPFRPVPDHLKTKAQLYELGFSTGKTKLPRPVACIARQDSPGGWLFLYDPSQAEPRKSITPEQRANLGAAREKALKLWRCAECGSHLDWRRYGGLCGNCELDRMIGDDRQSVIRAFQRLAASEFVVLDTETTGLDAPEAIEITILAADGTVLMNQRVQPKGEIEPGATAVHGIHKEDLVNEPTFDVLYPHLVELLTGKRVAIYNADFDSGVLNRCCRLYELPLLDYEPWCVMEAYSTYCGDYSDYWGNYRWKRLPGGDHTALGDCRATLSLIMRIAGEGEGEQDDN